MGSTNGLLVDGELTDQALLKDGSLIQLGRGGPVLRVSLEGASPPSQGTGSGEAAAPTRDPSAAPATFRSQVPDTDPATQGPSPDPEASSGGPPSRGPLSLEEVQEKYLNPKSAEPAGEHTRMIRVAFDKVRKKQRRRSTVVLGAVLVLLAGAVAYGAYQRHRVSVLDRRAAEVFRTMKSYEVQLVQLRQLAEESGSQALEDQLTRIDSLRRDVMADYEGYVQDRGLYRKLGSVEERLIFHTARLFGESEFAVSGSFVEAVQEEIQRYWLSPGGRERYREALARARENGYTGRIVETMRGQGVPPEFFYLALQESDFKVDAVGPETRWGRAKGMWQFIPTTARRYGLDPGPLQDTGSRDPDDDREDFELASAAAARYLRDLHGVLTQASGLLVMAAYNWGEHRVAPRLEELPTPRDVFQAEFSEVPTNPEARNYWTFLNEHGDRMPAETKDYVLKIFSAAVIGQDPRHFGFEFENPLAPYLE
jgi:soluble lytic murein transglycosylase-like protein